MQSVLQEGVEDQTASTATGIIVSGSMAGTRFNLINLTKTNNGVPRRPCCDLIEASPLQTPTCLFQISGRPFLPSSS